MKRSTAVLFSFALLSSFLYAQESEGDSTTLGEVVSLLFGKNQPKLGFMSQFAAEGIDDGNNTGSQFSIRTLRLYLAGSNGEKFSYYLQGDVYYGRVPLDLKLMYRLSNQFTISGGLLRIPLSPEYLTNDAKLPFVNRSTVLTNLFYTYRSQYGIQMEGSLFTNRVSLAGGVFNAYNDNTTKISQIAGRLMLSPILSEESSARFRVDVGGGILYEYVGKYVVDDAYLRMSLNDYWMTAEYLVEGTTESRSREGFYVDFGKTIAPAWEIAFRFDWYDQYWRYLYLGAVRYDISRKYILGINCYPLKDVKIQFDYERDQTQKINSGYVNLQYAINFE